jgi:CHASE2 domain-containing sensor protein
MNKLQLDKLEFSWTPVYVYLSIAIFLSVGLTIYSLSSQTNKPSLFNIFSNFLCTSVSAIAIYCVCTNSMVLGWTLSILLILLASLCTVIGLDDYEPNKTR